MKYRKKPVVIEAVQFFDNTDCLSELADFMGGVALSYETDKPLLVIETLEGTMAANEGDYIIKGVNGEFYPCKPDVFEKTYEKVDEITFDGKCGGGMSHHK